MRLPQLCEWCNDEPPTAWVQHLDREELVPLCDRCAATVCRQCGGDGVSHEGQLCQDCDDTLREGEIYRNCDGVLL